MNNLERLLAEWEDEKKHYERIALKFNESVHNLKILNVEIFNECEKQGVDINTVL